MAEKRRYPSQRCRCCDRLRANERFSARNYGRQLCIDCARLPADVRSARTAEVSLFRLSGPGRFRRKRPLIARYLTHADPWVQLLAEAMLRPPQWDDNDWEDWQDWLEVTAAFDLRPDPLALEDRMPEAWWASVLEECAPS